MWYSCQMKPGSFSLRGELACVGKVWCNRSDNGYCRYGTTGKAVAREVYEANDGPTLDLNPPALKFSLVVSPNAEDAPSTVKTIQASSGWTVGHLKAMVSEAFGGDAARKSRIWHLPDSVQTNGTVTPSQLSEADLSSAQDTDFVKTAFSNDSEHLAFEQVDALGNWLVADRSEQAPATDTAIRGFGGKSFIDAKEEQYKRDNPKQGPAQPVNKPNGITSGAMKATRSQNNARDNQRRGLVGLTNLGNTCFMNSVSALRMV